MNSRRSPDTAVLLGDEADVSVLPEAWRTDDSDVRVLDASQARFATRYRRLFVMAAATRLDRVAKAVSEANHHNRLVGFFVRNDEVSPDWVTYFLSEANLRVLRNLLVHHGTEAPARVFQAWAWGAPKNFVADAAVVEDDLVVRDCTLESVRIGFDAYPTLASIPSAQRGAFEIEEDGYLLHWPSVDVHLDLHAMRAALDPSLRHRARRDQLRERRDLGEAIRQFRESLGLTQSSIEGLSERQLRRIEQGQAEASDVALDALARAHSMSPEAYLEAVTELLGQSDLVTPAATR